MTVNATNGAYNPATNVQGAPSAMKDLGQQDFLRLMVAQIQNQDPMQPQVNGEFLSQLAQFGANDGINKMQSSMQQMANSLQSNQALQASSLVGRKVMVDSNTLQLAADGKATAAVDVPSGFGEMTAFVYGSNNELLKSFSLGHKEEGFYQFAWDGTSQDGTPMSAGDYKIEVHGIYQGKEVGLTTMTSANVDSVSLDQYGDGLKLNVAGVGSIALSQVRQITV